MRIAYCTNVRLPSERAHSHQVAQVCDALVRLGHDVHIFAPYRINTVQEDYWTYFGADVRTTIEYIGSFDPIASPLFPGVLALWQLNMVMRRMLKTRLSRDRYDIAYTRSPALLPSLLASGVPTIVELHQLPRIGRRLFVRRCNRCVLVACLTSSMRDTLRSWGVKEGKLAVAGDAVDLHRFASVPTPIQAREMFGIRTDRLIVGYVGRLKTLGMEKGVGLLLQALAVLPRNTFFGLIVGGPQADRDEYEKRASELGLTSTDVLFTGAIEAWRIPSALMACDILAMPFPDVPHYRFNMSPLKMFEYMAAGKPIVTSDLPTIRDVLSEETASFCEPGDIGSLAFALERLKDNPQEGAVRAARAKELSLDFSWEKRMQRILSAATMQA